MKNIKSEYTPPKFAAWILEKINGGARSLSFIGDLYEIFRETAIESGLLKARLWYWKQILNSLNSLFKNTFMGSFIMLKNYLKIALRNLLKGKFYSTINITGLSIGISACIIAILFIRDEFSIDDFHVNGSNIYRVSNEFSGPTGKIYRTTRTRLNMADDLVENYPEVINSARVFEDYGVLSSDEKRFNDYIFFVDASFFELFTFPLIQGDPGTIMSEPNGAIISESLSEKFFGDKDPIGKTLTLEMKHTFVIKGIMKDSPPNSRIDYNMFVPISYLRNVIPEERYESTDVVTYLLLAEFASHENLKSTIQDFVIRKYGEKFARRKYTIQNIKDLYLNSYLDREIGKSSDIKYTYIYSTLALIILLIASINFINLSTARGIKRSQEIGLRKVVGARKKQLVWQFLGESVLTSFFAVFISVALIHQFLPWFNSYTGKELSFRLFLDWQITAGMIILALISGLVSGIYPALIVSRYSPVTTLKSQGSNKNRFLRRSLVVFQFSVSLLFIVCTFIVSDQMNYLRNKDLGFDTDNKMIFEVYDSTFNEKRFQLLKNELMQNPDIVDMTSGFSTPGLYNGYEMPFEIIDSGNNNKYNMSLLWIDSEFLDFYQVKFVEGRNFNMKLAVDRKGALILNESAVKLLGLENPIGKRIKADYEKVEGEIIGVVQDGHLGSLYDKIKPTVFQYSLDMVSSLSLSYMPGSEQELITYMNEKWNELYPGMVLNHFFMNERIERQYSDVEKTEKVYNFAALLSVLIACLGLFGLSSYNAESKIKEIGIRKVLGSSVSSIIKLMTKDFIILVLIANIFAYPTAYYIMSKWLVQFAYTAGIKPQTFFITSLITLSIALLTIIYQSFRSALANPVDSLRYE